MLVPGLIVLNPTNVVASETSDVVIPMRSDGRDIPPGEMDDWDSEIPSVWQGLYNVKKWENSTIGTHPDWPDENAVVSLNFYPRRYTYAEGDPTTGAEDVLYFAILTKTALKPNWRFDMNSDNEWLGINEDPLEIEKVEVTVKLLTEDPSIPILGRISGGWSNEYYGSYSYNEYPMTDAWTFHGDYELKSTTVVNDWFNQWRQDQKEWQKDEANKATARDIMQDSAEYMAMAAYWTGYGAIGAEASSMISMTLGNTIFAPSDPPFKQDTYINDDEMDLTMAGVFKYKTREEEYSYPGQYDGWKAVTKGDYGLVGKLTIERPLGSTPSYQEYDWEITAKTTFGSYWGGSTWTAESSMIVTMDNNWDHRFVKPGHGEDDPPVPVPKILEITDEMDRYKVVFSGEDSIPGENVDELYYHWEFGDPFDAYWLDSGWTASEKIVYYYPHDCYHELPAHNMCDAPYEITLSVSDSRYVRTANSIWIDGIPPPPPLPKADPPYGSPGLISTISWDPVDDPGSGVLKYETALDQTVSWTDRGLATSFQVGPLNAGDHIAYVRAVDNDHEVGPFGSVHIYVGDPPAPPTDITCEFDPASLDNIKLEWTLSADDGQGENDVIRYDIFRSESINGIYYPYDSVTAGINTYIDSEAAIIDTNSHYYSVLAVSDNGVAKEGSERAAKYVLSLDVGHSFVSFLPRPKDTSTSEVMKYVKERYGGFGGLIIFDSTDDKWKECWYGGKPWCEFSVLDSTMGFWIYMTSPGSLVVSGSIHPEELIIMDDGWGMYGYPSNVERMVSDALLGMSYTAVYEQATGACDHPASAPLSLPNCYRKMAASDIMKPGRGYWIKLDIHGQPWYLQNEMEQISIEDEDEENPPETEDRPCLPEWRPGGHCRLKRFDLRSSGIDYTKYRVDGGAWQIYEGTMDIPEGYHQLEFYSVDKSGNFEYQGHSPLENYALMDETTPETEIKVFDGREGLDDWYTSPVLLTFRADEGAMDVSIASGIKSTEYDISGQGWTTFEEPFWVDREGVLLISYYSEDAAGNVENTKGTEIKIDTIWPTVSLLQPLDGSSTQNQQPTFQWEGDDLSPGSGLSGDYNIQIGTQSDFMEYILVDEWIIGTAYTPTSPLDPDTYYWRVRAKDNAGNVGEWSSSWTVSIRAPPPTTTLLSPPDGSWTYDNTPTLPHSDILFL
jgi:hypothetical protein